MPAAVATLCAHGSTFCSPSADWAAVTHGPGCLLALPVPDFSMPYNAMSLVLIIGVIYLAGTAAWAVQHRKRRHRSDLQSA